MYDLPFVELLYRAATVNQSRFCVCLNGFVLCRASFGWVGRTKSDMFCQVFVRSFSRRP